MMIWIFFFLIFFFCLFSSTSLMFTSALKWEIEERRGEGGEKVGFSWWKVSSTWFPSCSFPFSSKQLFMLNRWKLRKRKRRVSCFNCLKSFYWKPRVCFFVRCGFVPKTIRTWKNCVNYILFIYMVGIFLQFGECLINSWSAV